MNQNLADELRSIPTSSSKYQNQVTSITKKFSFSIIDDCQVYEHLLKLDSSKGAGVDETDIKWLKAISDIISPHLACLFYQSLLSNIYPDCFKFAKFVPVSKAAPLDPSVPARTIGQ